jgi:hypothetical protein
VLCGSAGIAVVEKLVIRHQEDMEEFSLFFGWVSRKSLLAHGFVMR